MCETAFELNEWSLLKRLEKHARGLIDAGHVVWVRDARDLGDTLDALDALRASVQPERDVLQAEGGAMRQGSIQSGLSARIGKMEADGVGSGYDCWLMRRALTTLDAAAVLEQALAEEGFDGDRGRVYRARRDLWNALVASQPAVSKEAERGA